MSRSAPALRGGDTAACAEDATREETESSARLGEVDFVAENAVTQRLRTVGFAKTFDEQRGSLDCARGALVRARKLELARQREGDREGERRRDREARAFIAAQRTRQLNWLEACFAAVFAARLWRTLQAAREKETAKHAAAAQFQRVWRAHFLREHASRLQELRHYPCLRRCVRRRRARVARHRLVDFLTDHAHGQHTLRAVHAYLRRIHRCQRAVREHILCKKVKHINSAQVYPSEHTSLDARAQDSLEANFENKFFFPFVERKKHA